MIVTFRRLVGVLSIVAVVGVQASGEQKRGKPVDSMTYGAGWESCGKWVEDSNAKGNANASMRALLRLSWVQGFLTAVGAYGGVPMRTTDEAAIRGFINQYCLQHPLETVAQAADTLYIALQQ